MQSWKYLEDTQDTLWGDWSQTALEKFKETINKHKKMCQEEVKTREA